MNLYRCRWPNGDVSFVLAPNKKEACYYLDQFADPDPRWLQRIPEHKAEGFIVGFRPVEEADGQVRWDSDGDESEELYELLYGYDDEEYEKVALQKQKEATACCCSEVEKTNDEPPARS